MEKSMEKSNDNTVKRIVLSTSTNIVSDTQFEPDLSHLSKEQLYAYNKFTEGANLFITGPGGTGKTRLIKHLLDYAKSIQRNIQICAMTGCAAVLLNCNARTLHSWSGIKLAKGTKKQVVDSVLKNKRAVAQWRKTKCLILDEVSMLSKKIFEIIEEIARKTTKINLPFGGIQVIFTGDFYQLPPIGTNGDPDTDRFCFESNSWSQVFTNNSHIVLTTIFRQTDQDYINILQQIRIGEISKESSAILQKYVKRTYDAEQHNNCVPTKLFPLRSKTDYVNSMMFAKLKATEHVFTAIRKTDCSTHIDSNKPLSTELLLRSRRLSAAEVDYELDIMTNNSPCITILRLKIGSAVMCTVNLDIDKGICNGSQGVVIDIKPDQNTDTIIPVVRFANGVIKHIQNHYWQSEDFPTLAIGQFPLCLAWALTIHKIQGATLDMAEIDIGQSIFEYGQTYVALSRVQSLHGLYLSDFQPQRIAANPVVHDFYKNIPEFDMTNTVFNTVSFAEYELKEESYDQKDTKKISL
jgi:ATP-dependent DNA helicase PIF1